MNSYTVSLTRQGGPYLSNICLLYITTTARHSGKSAAALPSAFFVSISVVTQAILPVELIDTTLGSRCLLRAGVE